MDGVALIAAERERQIEEEGWGDMHDDSHRSGELVGAAICYAIQPILAEVTAIMESNLSLVQIHLWPFEEGWFKSGDPIRDLVKAGALIAAEIDRRQRNA